jgi:hypothetical protein
LKEERLTLREKIVAAFTTGQVHVDALPDSDPVAIRGKECSELFTAGVATLRVFIPNERIRALANMVWDLVGNKRVQVALGPEVPSLTFAAMDIRGSLQGIVFIPRTWPAMTKEDAFMQLGAILFVGAQIVDFYNDPGVDNPTNRARWHAYEAELLFTLCEILVGWRPNEYQLEVMKKYPDGLDTKGVELYESKPFDPSEPAKPVKSAKESA